MTIVVHRREVAIWQGDWALRIEEAAFDPLPASREERPSGCLVDRPASVPIRVTVPAGSQVRDGRLVAHCARLGWDALTVLHVARGERHGCRIEPVAPSVVPEPVMPPSPYAVLFRSLAPGYPSLCFAADAGAGVVASTLDPTAARTWPDADAANDWLRSVGLDESQAVPIGSPGWLYPVIEPFRPEWWLAEEWPRALEFRYRVRGAGAAPPPTEQARPAARPVQLLLFGEALP